MNLRFESESFGALPRLKIRDSVASGSLRVDTMMKSAFHVSGEAQSNLDRLLSGGAMCVTSGQQPGLFTGPLYTIYKALSAVALAGTLESRLGRPVVPVFWVAGDDHDFLESNHCYVPSLKNEVVRLELRGRDIEAAMTPLYREILGDDIDRVMNHLESITPDTEFRGDILEWIRSHYTADSDMSSAFGRALAELMGRFGLVVFFPTSVRAKQSMGSWIRTALEKAGEIDRNLESHATDLKSKGMKAPISVGDAATTVLIEASLGRDRLIIDGHSFRTRRSGEEFPIDAVDEVIAKEPERLSPNVLLRPVVEAAILPTVAYVAGPGELAYLPQAAPLYEALGVEPQIPVPRWSGRVIEKRTDKVLEKYDIDSADLQLPEGQLEARIMKDQVPVEATAALRTLQETLEREYGRVKEAVGAIDAALEKTVVAAERGAQRDVTNVEKRIARALKQQNETTLRQIGNARRSLFPMGKPQERIINVTHFLIRYGTEFLDAVFEQCKSWADTLETDSGEA